MIHAHLDDYVDRFVIDYGHYEKEVIDAITANLNAGDVLWDVGANIGLHGITAQRLVPTARVVCFEPSPFTFARLQRNARSNASTVELRSIALSDRCGYADLDVLVSGNSGISSLVSGWVPDPTIRVPCRCETALACVERGVAPMPNVVKLDVEGHELAVLRGFGHLLECHALRVILFEGRAECMDDPKNAAVVEVLLRAGFHIQRLERSNPAESDNANYLARRSPPSS